MKIVHICFIVNVSVTLMFSQDINQAEVKVLEGFVPEIPESEKIKETTEFIDTTEIDKSQSYSFLNKTLDIPYKSRPLKSAKLSGEKISDLDGSKIFLGGGTHSFLSNISHNSLRKEDYSYGLTFNHFSNRFKVKYDNNSNTEVFRNSLTNINVFGKKIEENNIFILNLDYDRRTSNYDGFCEVAHKDCNLNRFSYSKFGGCIFSRELSEYNLKHNTSFFVSDLNSRSENQIHLKSNLSKKINSFPVDLELEFNNYINYANTDSLSLREKTDVKTFHIVPNVGIERFGYNFNVGAEIHLQQELDSMSTPGFAPHLIVSKHLVKNILYVEGGLRHSEYRSTIKSLSDENPFIRALGTNQLHEPSGSSHSLSLDNTDVDEFFVGMTNVLGKGEVFEGSIAYGKISNMPFFYWVDLNENGRFYSSYVDIYRLHANANYEWKINDLININATANFYNYDTIASNKENINGKLGISLNLDEKIKFNTDLSYVGKRQSLNGENIDGDYFVDWDEVYELNSQLHANISIDYHYTNSIAAYLRINNILNSKQELWKGYREIGINAWFGLSYSF